MLATVSALQLRDTNITTTKTKKPRRSMSVMCLQSLSGAQELRVWGMNSSALKETREGLQVTPSPAERHS